MPVARRDDCVVQVGICGEVAADPGRDGEAGAPSPEAWPTLQRALDDWNAAEPALRAIADQLDRGALDGATIDPNRLGAPLPRAYEWVDGSAYINHIVLVRKARNAEPLKRWKLSDMDLAEHELYVKYSMAKDTTFQYTDIKQAPWYVVPSDDKKAARLNCISHLLSQFDYEDVAPEPVELPQMRDIPYVRPPMHEQTFVPQLF